MTNDEIRAHLAQLRKALQSQTTGLHAVSCDAIETLLAREAEVLKWAKGKHGVISAADEENGYFIAVKTDIVYEQIRAILNPQPAALAEENDNGN